MEGCVSDKGYEQLLAAEKRSPGLQILSWTDWSLNAGATFMWDPGLLPDQQEGPHSQYGHQI